MMMASTMILPLWLELEPAQRLTAVVLARSILSDHLTDRYDIRTADLFVC
jgi:hypothetical protein